ncbi:MAG TPA: TIM-barrel domain-containing protein [Bacteroidales bacterium]|nr:TIM-barrel domain-containing protein [Bacteroidales bacterium]
MKKLITVWLCFTIFIFCANAQTYNPVADKAAIVTSGSMRFTVLTPEMIRIEHSTSKQFEDRASFVVLNRKLPVPGYSTKTENGYLYITTNKLELKYKVDSDPMLNDPCDPNLQITLDVNGVSETWYPSKVDPYNLKGTARTLDNAEGDVRKWLEDGLISRSGWAVIDEQKARNDGSYSLMFDGSDTIDWVAQRKDPASMDMYFLGYGHNYKKALNDFTLIAGKIPLPPQYVFGYWYSKYQRYKEQDLRDIVSDIKTRNIPVDVLVIDMDWHMDGFNNRTDQTQWTGWSWNKALFPDPKGFISWLHSQNLKTTLNLHPADGIGMYEENFTTLAKDLGVSSSQTIPWNIENKNFYKAFFNDILRPHENMGVDFWWLDWQQWMLARNEPKLGNTFWLNHVFFNDKKFQGKDRPLIFHRWGGLGNHRYQIGFSGDTYTTFPSLAFQPYFTATAGNVCYGYWSHDIGGHQQPGANDPELYLRWIQYGVFSPILRTHATNASNIERRIWMYNNFPLMRDAIKLRYSLIPYIYTNARYAYDTGISLCRPMYYDYPEQEDAYTYEGEYMFGNDILVAPICKSAAGDSIEQTIWLPEGKWYEVVSDTLLDGGQVTTRKFTQAQIPYYYREGAVIPLYPSVQHLNAQPDTIIVQFAPGNTGECLLYEDENNNGNYEKGSYTNTRITQSTVGNTSTYTVNARTGTFSGMPDKRSFRFQMLNKTQPGSVKVNGSDATYTYNSNSRKIEVKVDNVSYSSLPLIIVVVNK